MRCALSVAVRPLPPPAHLLLGHKIPLLVVPSQQLGTAAQRHLSPLVPRSSCSGVLPWLPSGRPGYPAGGQRGQPPRLCCGPAQARREGSRRRHRQANTSSCIEYSHVISWLVKERGEPAARDGGRPPTRCISVIVCTQFIQRQAHSRIRNSKGGGQDYRGLFDFLEGCDV